MYTKLKWIAMIGILVFVVLQFTGPSRTNPSYDQTQTLEATTAVPSEVSAVFARSCGDCHSNNTNWRWYTYVAPVSWFTVGHVNDARAELNFSEWGTYGARMKKTRLSAICELTKLGSMPLASYVMMHREVVLSPDEVKRICEWTSEEEKLLASAHP